MLTTMMMMMMMMMVVMTMVIHVLQQRLHESLYAPATAALLAPNCHSLQ
jgi:hypothetical protein